MLPHVLRADGEGLDLAAWLSDRWLELSGLVDEHGAVLLRGFCVEQLDDFQFAVAAATPALLDYVEPSTPRREIAAKVFTSTEYPNDQTIPLHNEMSYRGEWPMYLWFWCQRPASAGGCTTLADSHRIADGVPYKLRRRFADAGVTYRRTFNTGFDLTWQHVFRTDSRDDVERTLRSQGVTFRWLEDEILQTWQTIEGLVHHPRTGQEVWFNQATLFHPSALDPALRAALEAALGEDRLPRTATYGDGAPIGDADLATIRAVGDRETVRFDWRAGDVLLVDNIATAHGRDPFSGERRVRVAMSEIMRSTFQGPVP